MLRVERLEKIRKCGNTEMLKLGMCMKQGCGAREGRLTPREVN